MMHTETGRLSGAARKAVAAAVAMTLALGMCPASALAATDADAAEAPEAATQAAGTLEASHVWDGTADTSWYSDAVDSFTLTAPEQLAGLAVLVNEQGKTFEGKTVALGADMQMNDRAVSRTAPNMRNWTPIAYAEKDSGDTSLRSFRGTLDGAGHTIAALYCFRSESNGYAGLFGYLDRGGCVKNLAVTGFVSGNVSGAIAASFGTLGAGAAPSIENCTSACTVNGTGSGKLGTGGILGGNANSGSTGFVVNCYNTGAVTNAYRPAGGVVGVAAGETIAGCYNTGAVKSAAGSSYEGGVLATLNGGSQIGRCYFLDGSAPWGISYPEPARYSNAVSRLTGAQLRAQSAVDGLGGMAYMANGDVSVNRGYPLLFWQAGQSQISLSDATCSQIPDRTYTDGPSFPKLTITYGSYTLSEGQDYKLLYKNVTGPGTAQVTAVGMGRFTGSVVRTFEVAPLGSIADADVAVDPEFDWMGSAIKVSPTVTYGGARLSAARDYTVSIATAAGNPVASVVDAGDYVLTVTGKGGYTGSKSVRFSVVARGGQAVQRQGLSDELDAARALAAATKTSDAGADVAKDAYWATADAVGAFSSAIEAAQAVYDDAEATQEQVDAATSDLRSAQSAFEAQRKLGTGEVDKSALQDAVRAAGDDRNATYMDEDGSNTPVDEQWATRQDIEDFVLAIESARTVANNGEATQAQVDAAVSDLAAARAAFDAAKRPGTKAVEPDPDPDPQPQPQPATWERLAGKSALDTMAAIADAGWSGTTGGTVLVAAADGYWDALTASGLAGLADAPVLLTSSASLSAQTASALEALQPGKVVVCGGPVSVSDDVLAQIEDATGVAPVRVSGQTATGTADAIAREAASITGGSFNGQAIVATVNSYYDALSAAPYAYAKGCPVFLTEPDGTLSAETLSAMKAAGVRDVYIAGGTLSVPLVAESEVRGAGMNVADRFAGTNAVDTSVLVAQFGVDSGLSANNMGVAMRDGYWDALTGAALCGHEGAVLVLVADDDRSAIEGFAIPNAAAIENGYVFGGVQSVSEETVRILADAVNEARGE